MHVSGVEMGTTRLFLCLTVVACSWAKSTEEVDLNLKSIFRTPRDFSKVNFDHFELLERNNFKDENKDAANAAAENKEKAKAEDKHAKSVANAQVMLRIGGEDIHDCNRVILHHPPAPAKEHNYYNEPHHQPVYNTPYYPHPYTGYPYVHQPYSFPGYYYNPGHVPNFLPSGCQTPNNHLVQNEAVTKPPDTVTSITYIEDGEEPFQTEVKTEVCSETPQQQVIVQTPSHCQTQTQTQTHTQVVHAPVQEKVCVTHPEPIQATLVETSYTNTQSEQTPIHECSTEIPICTTTPPAPVHHKVEYVEVNLASSEKPCVEPPKEHPCHVIQHDSVPAPAPHENPVVVSHTEVGNSPCASHHEEVVIPEAHSSSLCEPCHNEGHSDIPYDHRLSKHADSLHEIADNGLYSEDGDRPSLEQRKLETAVPVHEENHSHCTTHEHEHEHVQVINPCHEAIERHYETQDNPTNVECPCETKTVIEEQQEYQQPPGVEDTEWSSQKVCVQPSQQEEETVDNATPETHEHPCGTQEVTHESDPHSNSDGEWSPQSSYHHEEEESNCPTKPRPVVYHNEYKSRDVSRYGYGNPRPKVYYGSHCGYYPDPIRSVVYRHPRVYDPYRYSNSPYPVVERVKYVDTHSGYPIREHVRIVHPFSSFFDSYRWSPLRQHANCHHKFSEPHIYKIVPKYNIIPRRDIRQVNIPDLVPTNQYLKINPHRQVSHREYDNEDKVPVSRNEYYAHKPQYSNHIPAQREVPEVPEECKPCSRYRGELDELS